MIFKISLFPIPKASFLTRVSENLVKIVSRCSKLKSDDYRLKGLTHSHIVCSRCDHYAVENIEHLLMQCPASEVAMSMMYEQIRKIMPEYDYAMTNHPDKIVTWLLGGYIEGLDFTQMLPLWMISGNAINRIYREVVQERNGIG